MSSMTQGVAARFDDARVHLRLLGAERQVALRVRVDRCTVRELLEPARAISAEATTVAVAEVEGRGQQVRCGPACAACCRQLVPISVVEAALLAEVVAAMPEERRVEVRARFAAAVQMLERCELLDKSQPRGRQALVSGATTGAAAWDDVSRRYFAAGIPCPFLEAESCSIYQDRPIVCREYNVVSAPDQCATLDGGAQTTARPVRMSEALGEAAAEALALESGTLPLTLALEWAEAHGARLTALRDGEELFWTLMRQVDAQSANPFDAR
jgi:Fe-S-cluster containining protein